jgi:hypothetical protein
MDGHQMLNEGFLGGPAKLFDSAGREQLTVLLEHELTFASTVLDIGCGPLRGGRWIMPLLDRGHYCGLEPQRQLVERGLRDSLAPGIADLKAPRFDHNDRFDFSVFGTRFTHFLARSIWTHAGKPQMETMLDGFAAHGSDDAVLLASFIPASSAAGLPRPVARAWRRFVAHPIRPDYTAERWVGRSLESEEPGMVAHRFDWIREACERRGLEAAILTRPPLQKNGQIWSVVRRA